MFVIVAGHLHRTTSDDRGLLTSDGLVAGDNARLKQLTGAYITLWLFGAGASVNCQSRCYVNVKVG